MHVGTFSIRGLVQDRLLELNCFKINTNSQIKSQICIYRFCLHGTKLARQPNTRQDSTPPVSSSPEYTLAGRRVSVWGALRGGSTLGMRWRLLGTLRHFSLVMQGNEGVLGGCLVENALPTDSKSRSMLCLWGILLGLKAVEAMEDVLAALLGLFGELSELLVQQQQVWWQGGQLGGLEVAPLHQLVEATEAKRGVRDSQNPTLYCGAVRGHCGAGRVHYCTCVYVKEL